MYLEETINNNKLFSFPALKIELENILKPGHYWAKYRNFGINFCSIQFLHCYEPNVNGQIFGGKCGPDGHQ